MPFVDTYRDTFLDSGWGGMPATGGDYRLYSDNPALADAPTDVELASDGGYAPVTFAPSDWASSSSGSKTTTDPVDFGTSTDAYSDVALYWGVAVSSGADLVYYDALDTPIEVDDSDTDVSFSPSLLLQDGG